MIVFCVGFPTLCYRQRNLFICRRKQSVCHVVSTWRVDWAPLSKCAITLIGCSFMAHFDLVLRLGGSLQPKVLVLETLAVVFIFLCAIYYKVGKHLLSVYARNCWMNEEQLINNATII